VEIENKLRALGYALPEPSEAAGNYIQTVQVGNILFIGGNIGRFKGQSLKYTGQVGDRVTVEQAYESARNVALNHLAKIKIALGDLDRVERIVKVNGYVNAAPGFNQMAEVLNGESDLLVALWGEKGKHVRTAVGVSGLGRDAPVEAEVVVQVKD
jgi:enamine deaminase RidA (YjgF/YER057c/UK114 family)